MRSNFRNELVTSIPLSTLTAVAVLLENSSPALSDDKTIQSGTQEMITGLISFKKLSNEQYKVKLLPIAYCICR